MFRDLSLRTLVKKDRSFSPAKLRDVKERKRLSDLLPHQKAFLQDKETRHLGMVAGFGSGKSYSLSAKILQLSLDNPGCTGIAMEPTYGLINDVLAPQTQDLWQQWGVEFEFLRGAAEFHVKCPDGQTSKVLLRSFENYQRLRGVNAAWGCVDEIDTVKPSLASVAFQLLQGRIRSGQKPQIAVCSTPEGFGFLHDFFVEKDDQSKRLIRARTTDNPYLPPEYIQSLREQYPPALIESYLNGEFVNLAQTSIFSEFDRRIHSTDLTSRDIEQGREQVLIGLDFNVGQCMSCYGVMRGDVLMIVGELKGSDTHDTVRQIQRLFPMSVASRQVICYPDAAGAATNTVSTKTDHSILRDGDLQVRALRANPNVNETLHHANNLFFKKRILVNPRTCPLLVQSLERWAFDEQGKPVKGGVSDYSHSGDALRYLVWGTMNGARRTATRGHRIY